MSHETAEDIAGLKSLRELRGLYRDCVNAVAGNAITTSPVIKHLELHSDLLRFSGVLEHNFVDTSDYLCFKKDRLRAIGAYDGRIKFTVDNLRALSERC